MGREPTRSCTARAWSHQQRWLPAARCIASLALPWTPHCGCLWASTQPTSPWVQDFRQMVTKALASVTAWTACTVFRVRNNSAPASSRTLCASS